MKKIYIFLLLCCAPVFMKAQCFVQVQANPATCFGVCDGSAAAFPAGGTGPYTYVWTPGGQTTQTVNGLCAGTYTVTMVDAVGCTASGVATITQPAQIVVTLSPTNASCSSCCDGNIVSTVTGGTPPYYYQWNTVPVQNSPTAQSLCPGTYTLCVTDANGCMTCSSATVNFTTGIQEHFIAGELSVFPSPAINTICVQQSFGNAEVAEISVYNVLGERFYVKTCSAAAELKETISITGLPAGIYFVSVKTAGGTSAQRFIKQ